MNGTFEEPAPLKHPPGIENLTGAELARLAANPKFREVVRAEFSRRPYLLEVMCRGGCGKRLRLSDSEPPVPNCRYTCKVCSGDRSVLDTPNEIEAKPKRRMGRGKLVFPVKHWGGNSESSELDPAATTDQVDQTLTKLSLKSANSDNNAAILREHEKAADRIRHIGSGLSATQRDVLVKVLDVVEPGDSLQGIARKAGLYAPQISRAFAAAREADKLRIFKQANRERRPPAVSYRPYNPPVVPMETVMMLHQGPVLYTIELPDRIGRVHQHYAPVNGCSHPNREWVRVGFGGLRLTCLDCKAKLDRAGILSKP